MRILLIEDDMFFQKFYSLKLKEAGYEIETAIDGEQGLEKIRSYRPDLILLDLVMPKKDGFEVLEEKKQDTDIQAIPTLVFSTLGQEADIERAKNLGALDYINKSFFDFENLRLKIENSLPTPS
ncbi:MAG: hypothetical protein RI947_1285 [Candidatus Parcubacteria bacterium]|jgi:two-component system chemotaxis response regulator CheY